MPQNLPFPQAEVWTCARTRTSRNGLAVMPTAGPWPRPLQTVALDGGQEGEVIAGTAVNIGAPPAIPSPSSFINHPNRLYLGGVQSAAIPCLTFGGVKIYVVSYVLAYAILSPEGLVGDFATGVMPWDTDYAGSESIPASAQSTAVLNQNIANPLNGTQVTLPQVIIQIEGKR